MSSTFCTNTHICKNHLVQLLIICSMFDISKSLTYFFKLFNFMDWLLLLHREIGMAIQNYNIGPSSSNLSQTIACNICSRGKYNIQNMIICSQTKHLPFFLCRLAPRSTKSSIPVKILYFILVYLSLFF